MINRVTHVFLWLLALGALTVSAQAAGTLSLYEGRHFLLGFMQNEIFRFDSGRLTLRVYVATKRPTRVRVTMPWGTFRTYSLKSDSVLTVSLDPTLEVTQSEIPIKAAVELASDEPIAVYALSSLSLSSDAYAVLPTDAWGTEYFALCMSNDQYNFTIHVPNADSTIVKTPRLGEFMVIASEDRTTVYYEPTATTLGGIAPGSGNSVILDKGECLLVMSALGPKNSNDLTGTYILADKPVGFLTGHMRTSIPHLPDAMDGQYDTKNHLIEMSPPVALWDSNYVSVPYGTCAEGDYFRVVAARDNTTLTMTDDIQTYTVTLNRGEFAEFENVFTPAVWKADQPVLIGQYMYSDFLDPVTKADPCFVTLPPVERFARKMLFQAPSTVNQTQFNAFNVQIICTADALGSLTIDGEPITDVAPEILLQTIQETGLHWAVIPIASDKVYKLITSTGSFSGLVYAFGPFDSYSFPLGMSPDLPADSLAPVITAKGDCGRIEGMVEDPEPGIYEIFVDEKLSHNYKVDIDLIDAGSTAVKFSARPIDMYAHARVVITAVDRNGNESQFSYTYKAPSATAVSSIDLPKVGEGSTVCGPLVFTNTGDSSFTVAGLYIMNDPRATISDKPTFPLTLASGESLTLDVCYTATGDTTNLRAQVLIQYGCGLQWWIPVVHTAEQPAIAGQGWDFGDVLAGDTACARIAVINKGNTPVQLTQLNGLTLPEIFLVDTTGVFPYELGAGDTLWLKVCFTPATRQAYKDDPTAGNSYRLPNSLPLTGRGIAPEIVVADIDWKQRRIGTTNDSTLTLSNEGTAPAVLTMQTPLPDPDAAFFYAPEELFPLTLQPGSSVELPVRFAPPKAISYHTILPVGVDWKLHPPVQATLIGSGTLPAIDATDILFDTLIVGTYTDTVVTEALLAGGNELLTIDSLFLADGDISSFIISDASKRPQKIAVGSISPFAARFAPTRTGWHRARVAVVHDARENYKRDTAYFELAGYALVEDISEVELSIINTDAVFACREHLFTPVFDNTGSTLSFVVDSLVAEGFGADTTIVLPPPGVIAETGTTTLLPAFSLTPSESGQGIIRIRVYYHPADREEPSPRVSTHEQTILIQSSQLTIVPLEARDVVPSETPTLHLHGDITGAPTLEGSFAIHAGYNFHSFRPMHDTTSVVFVQSNGDTVRIRARVTEDKSGVTITPEQFGDIALPARWSVMLPLFVFLNVEETPDVTVTVHTSDCLLGDSIVIPFHLTGICSFETRNVRYRPVIVTNIRPNPVAENAFLDISLPEDEVVSINVVDQLGRTFTIAEKMYLKKGKYSYKLSVADFNSGLYSLVVILSDSVSLHHFLINK